MITLEQLKSDLALAGYGAEVYNSVIEQSTNLEELSTSADSADFIHGFALWAFTVEGTMFWSDVHDSLLKI